MAALQPAAAIDDAAPPPAPPVDPDDITKWNELAVPSLPLPAQDYVADNFRALCSAHAGLLLCFTSPEVEATFLEQVQALYTGFQDVYQHPATVEDVRRCPSVGCNAYNKEEVQWFEATYGYLEGQLDNAEQAKRMLPAKKQQRGGRSATSAPAASAVASTAAAAGPRTTPRAARADDMEDDSEPIFVTPVSKKERTQINQRFCAYSSYSTYSTYSTDSTYPFFIFWIFCILSIFDIFGISDIFLHFRHIVHILHILHMLHLEYCCIQLFKDSCRST
jgi:hypothetical protein